MTTLASTHTSVSPAERYMVDVILAAGFRLNTQNGWFYPPGGNDHALVRLSVFGGQYRIERRRKPTGLWMVIATMDVEEFDAHHFHQWREVWQLTAQKT